MRRRDILTLAMGAVVAASGAAAAQAAGGPRLVAMLMGFAERDAASRALVTEFRATLARLGWNDGGKLRLQLRWGEGDVGKIAAFAKELVALKPDVMLGQTTPVAVALARATPTIPIVFVTVSDPIGSDLAQSISHPGGNVTGFTFVDAEMGGKWVELLKEVAPATREIGLLFNPATAPPLKFYLPSITAAAASFGIAVSTRPVHAAAEIEAVIAAQARRAGGGLIIMPDAFNAANHGLIIGLTARYRVPAVYGNDFAEAGGLIFYGADFADSFRLAAGYVDRILRGARPGELPIQLPARFALTVNLQTAKALGLAVPVSLRQRADLVIE